MLDTTELFIDDNRDCLNELLGHILLPEHRVDSEFVCFVNQHYKVVAENLTERFVDHRNVALASEAVSEFAFHHAKG